jgi:hypothetical protein
VNDGDFGNVFHACENLGFGKFYNLDVYLFKENKLCVPNNFMHELLIHEAYRGRIMGHFCVTKTLEA